MQRSILIDASHWGSTHPTGVELYTDSLLPLLLPLLLENGFENVHLLSHKSSPPIPLPDHVHWHVEPYKKFWSQKVVRRWQKKLKPDLYFTPSGIPPVGSSCATAITVHDVSMYRSKNSYSLGQHLRMRLFLKAAAKKAAVICVPSMYVAQEVSRMWNITTSTIEVTPLAVPLTPIVCEAKPAWVSENPLILYVGRIEIKKNLLTLIEAFSILKDTSAQLVLAGGDGIGAKHVRANIGSLPESVQKRIVLPGYVSEGEKKWLYSNAMLCAVPSPYEGFGLPVLEAFAANVPVICSNEGAVPEIAGDAALKIDSFDAASWTEALYSGLHDEALRDQLKQLGSKRFRHFTWEKTAQSTLKAFLTAL